MRCIVSQTLVKFGSRLDVFLIEVGNHSRFTRRRGVYSRNHKHFDERPVMNPVVPKAANQRGTRMKNSVVSKPYGKSRRGAPLAAIRIRRAAGNFRRGWIIADDMTIPVALGRNGVMANKREGDGGTP